MINGRAFRASQFVQVIPEDDEVSSYRPLDTGAPVPSDTVTWIQCPPGVVNVAQTVVAQSVVIVPSVCHT